MKLSFYRSLIFSGFQNKIIEAERRGNITEVFNSIQKFKDDNLYKTQNINIEQIKNNCELVPVYIERIRNNYFKMFISKPIKINNKKSIIEITKFLNDLLERMILKNIDQWIWTHNRWKN